MTVESEQARRAEIYLRYHANSLEAQRFVHEKRFITAEEAEYMEAWLRDVEHRLLREKMLGYGVEEPTVSL